MDLATLRIDEAELRARVIREAETLHAEMEGTADVQTMAPLQSFLRGLHGAARASTTGEVVIDLRRMDFMSSSCFKAFVSWLSDVQDLPDGDRYRIRFRSDRARHWQKRSLSALSCFAIDLVRIDTE